MSSDTESSLLRAGAPAGVLPVCARTRATPRGDRKAEPESRVLQCPLPPGMGGFVIEFGWRWRCGVRSPDR